MLKLCVSLFKNISSITFLLYLYFRTILACLYYGLLPVDLVNDNHGLYSGSVSFHIYDLCCQFRDFLSPALSVFVHMTLNEISYGCYQFCVPLPDFYCLSHQYPNYFSHPSRISYLLNLLIIFHYPKRDLSLSGHYCIQF